MRLGLITVMCLGFSGWFLYDGVVAYPAQRVRALKYQELEKEGRLIEWKQVAAEQGWPEEQPGEPKHEIEIRAQLVYSAVMAVPGVIFAVLVFRARGRWIELDETGFRTSWGQQFEVSQITQLNKKKWQAKGIVKVYYEEEDRRRRLVLDDCKYDPDPTAALLREIESRLAPEQIVGGAPQSPPAEEQDSSQWDEDETVEDAAESLAPQQDEADSAEDSGEDSDER
jgi:hypothetical protein